MIEKLCVYCNHMDFGDGRVYSEYTSDPAWIGCGKGHWECHSISGEFRVNLKMAETCPDYDEAKP